MEIVEKIIKSPFEPKRTNIGWFDTSENELKFFINGKWTPSDDKVDVAYKAIGDEDGVNIKSGYAKKSEVDLKIDSPNVPGVTGQVLQLDSNGKPEWVTPSAGTTPDSQMSEGSTNAVQNKVIKEYIDGELNQLGQNLIFTSTTDNYLDIVNVERQYRLTYDAHFAPNTAGCVLSRLIYVGDIAGNGSVTISGYVNQDGRILVFLSAPKYEDSAISYWVNLTGTSRTIPVPTGALYCVVTLKYGTDGEGYDNMKLSKTTSIATQIYQGKFLGHTGLEEMFNEQLKNSIDNIKASINNIISIVSPLDAKIDDRYINLLSGVRNIIGKKIIPFNAVYGSNTDNFFDKDNVIFGWRVKNSAPYLEKNTEGIMSRLIPVRGKTKMTISNVGNDNVGPSAIIFINNILTLDIVNWYNIGDSLERTIDVPANANYALIGLKYSNGYGGNYENVKVSLTNTPATEIFSPVFYGFAEYPELLGKEIASKEYVDTHSGSTFNYNFIKNTEHAEVEQRGIPFAYSSKYITSAQANNQYERFNFIFAGDSHIDSAIPYSLQNVEDMINFANETKIPIKFCLHAGDVVTPYGAHTKTEVDALIKSFFDAIKESNLPVLYTVGNHDTNDWLNLPEYAYTDADFDRLYLSWLRINHGTIHNVTGSFSGKSYQSDYYYKDFNDVKVRVICLNNMDYPVGDDYSRNVEGYSGARTLYDGGHSFAYRQEQIDWLINEALNFSDKIEKDWGIIVCTHNIISNVTGQYYSVNNAWGDVVVSKEDTSLLKMIKILKALNTQDVYSSSYICPTESEFNLNINVDYSNYAGAEKKPYVIGVFIGHEHEDFNKVIEGINVICIGNNSATSVSSDSRVARIPGSSTQNLFDVVSVDLEKKKIYTTRYGAGLNAFGVGGDRFKPDGLSF